MLLLLLVLRSWLNLFDEYVASICDSDLTKIINYSFFILPHRKFWGHLWKEQIVLWWEEEVSEHWYHHCAELRLPCPSQSFTHHFCSWSWAQLWLSCKSYSLKQWFVQVYFCLLLRCASYYCMCSSQVFLCCVFSFPCLTAWLRDRMHAWRV